jgi:L-malate glycosyltransferase
LRVLIVGRGMPSVSNEMIGIFEYQMAQALSKRVDVMYLSIDYRAFHRGRHYIYNINNDQGFISLNISIPTLGRFTPTLIFNIISMSVIKYCFYKFGPFDITHFRFASYASYFTNALSFIKLNGSKLVISEGNSEILRDNKKSFIKKRSQFYKLFDRVFSVSNSLKSTLIEVYHLKDVLVVPPAVNETFSYKPVKKYDRFTFISIGTLNQNKNHESLIRIFNEIYGDNNDFQLIIIGRGPLLSHLKKISCTNVVFMGFLDRIDVLEMLRKSHVFVLLSRLETFGNVFIEALSCGLPVIASRSQGPLDFITEKNGLLVDIDDSEEIKKAILTIKLNYNSYSQEEISNDILDSHSPEAISKLMINEYDSLINIEGKLL